MKARIVTHQPDAWKLNQNSEVIDDPLTDCLVCLARLYDRQISRTSIRAGLPLVHNRLTVQLFSRAANRAGLSSRVLEKKLSDISNLELPCILLLKESKAVILHSIDPKNQSGTILLPDADMGSDSIPMDELQAKYTGYSIFARPEFNRSDIDSIKKTNETQKNWFWSPLWSSWRIYRDVIVASFLLNLFGLLSPFFILNVYDRVIPNQAFETLWVLSIGIGIVYLFSLIMRGLRGYFIDIAGKKANLLISSTLFEKVLGLKISSRPDSIGSFSNKIQQFDSLRDFITSFSLTALVDLPFAILSLLAIWYLGGDIVFVHILSVIFLLIYVFFVQMPLKDAVERSFSASSQRNSVLVEGLNGLETLKMLGAESKIQRAYEESVGHISTWGTKSRLLSSSVGNVANFIQSLTVVGVVIAGVYTIAKGAMSQGGLIAVVMLTRQAIAPMTQVVGLAARYHRARASFNTLKEIMELPIERQGNKTFLHRNEILGNIEFKDVCFSYPGQKSTVLNNLSFSVRTGERIGIVGAVGSGKTTITKLLLGFYEPASGMITMDGVDLKQIDPVEVRRFIGCVPQDITLFRGTLRENIAFGRENINDSELLRVAELSGVATFAKIHELGFDMPVGEQGRLLSGGQRQAVAMARALLLDPPILLLDEPTSAMDAKNETIMRQQLTSIIQHKTLILSTHRASLLALVDRIIVLSNGSIVADGPRNEILTALRDGQISL